MIPRVTISMPCYRKPQRTARAISCILNQTIEDWEAIILGDGCPNWDEYEYLLDDPRIISDNFFENKGKWGTHLTNYAIWAATGKYFMFMGNDDVIEPFHVEHYLSEIEDTDLDFVWFDDYTLGEYHRAKMKYASIGHSNLIIRTDFLRSMPLHRPSPCQDWELIEDMIQTAKYRKSKSNRATYHIMTNFYNRIDPQGID